MNNQKNSSDNYDLREIVRKAYGEVAQQDKSCCGSSCCGNTSAEFVATNLGYQQEDFHSSRWSEYGIILW